MCSLFDRKHRSRIHPFSRSDISLLVLIMAVCIIVLQLSASNRNAYCMCMLLLLLSLCFRDILRRHVQLGAPRVPVPGDKDLGRGQMGSTLMGPLQTK